MKLCFQNGNIPKNRTPSLFALIFSSAASELYATQETVGEYVIPPAYLF